MTSNELAEGITIVYDMETNNYLMTRAIQNLRKQAIPLGKKRNIIAPKRKKVVDENKGTYTNCGMFGALVGAVVFTIVSLNWWGLGAPLIVILIGGLLGFVVAWSLARIPGQAKYKKKVELAEKQYQRERENYKLRLSQEKERVNNEIQLKNYILMQKEILEDKLCESQELLVSFYGTLGIDERFRNIVPIGYMYEFIRLGIARELGGDKGLYYLIMQELRWDQLNCTLQEISNKLDQIINNQKLLYQELVNINHACDYLVENAVYSAKLLADTKKQAEKSAINSEVTAYNTTRCAAELEYQSFMRMLSEK